MKIPAAMGSGFFFGIALPLLLAMAVNAYGLTTFGKSQNNNQNQQTAPQTPIVRGRECNFEADCQQIQNTSCVMDTRDNKLRCLCGDNQAPVNGICKAKFKGPKHSCMMDEDCTHGATCVENKVAANRNAAPKICKCNEGMAENGQYCSGSALGQGITTGLVLVTILFTRTNILY